VKKIGITGGIGTGKTLICQMFSLLGVLVYNADLRSKEILQTATVKEKLRHVFGEKIFENENISRKKLAEIVFVNPELLHQLNSILHPAVFADFDNWCEQNHHQHYVLKEAALIYETIIHQKLDKIIVVTAPEKIRIKRAMLRDNLSETEIRNRMKNQMSEEEKISRADFIIYNDDKNLVIPQIINIHQQIMR
jgi:dephospho-CoA kinase